MLTDTPQWYIKVATALISVVVLLPFNEAGILSQR